MTALIDQATTLRSLMAQERRPRASVIAITSGKGGVGKSNVAVNLAIKLSSAGKRVVLLDADLGLANADVLCNVELPCNLSHVIARKKELHDVMVEAPGGFRLIGGASGLARMADLTDFERQRIVDALGELEETADIIGAPLRVVGNAEDLVDALCGMQDCDFVLIDTAGRSPNDAMKLNELKSLLAVAEPDEVHLVLSTTASEACIELAISRFSEVRADKIIFTKLDEAAHVGVVLNVVRKVNKGLSYLTTGQDVPDDIEVGRGRRLAQLILGSGL